MREIYESSIPTKCPEDCKHGLIFADPIDKQAQVFVFACYCPRGSMHRHYPRWHPVRSKHDFTRSKEEVSITPTPDPLAQQEEIPECLIEHFVSGNFISDAWGLLRELYGRDQLAKWYRAWKSQTKA